VRACVLCGTEWNGELNTRPPLENVLLLLLLLLFSRHGCGPSPPLRVRLSCRVIFLALYSALCACVCVQMVIVTLCWIITELWVPLNFSNCCWSERTNDCLLCTKTRQQQQQQQLAADAVLLLCVCVCVYTPHTNTHTDQHNNNTNWHQQHRRTCRYIIPSLAAAVDATTIASPSHHISSKSHRLLILFSCNLYRRLVFIYF